MAEAHLVRRKPTLTNWHVLSCNDCDWWDGFQTKDDAEAAKTTHELTGEDVRGQLREMLASGAA